VNLPDKPVHNRVHIGSGPNLLPGWINVDLNPLPGLDLALDVRKGLPFHDVTLLFAEHFLEHLTLEEGLAFLKDCRRILTTGGTLRLSTPNLDWVILTHYHGSSAASREDAINDSLRLNRAFHGWGHRFLYNGAMLEGTLRAAGFERVRFEKYRESSVPELRGLEQHETYDDVPDLPHVLVAEAEGRAEPKALPEPLFEEFRAAFQV
jgi:predicted SAM-dependent methyltransferase